MSIATPRDFSVAVREDPVLLDASRYWENLNAYREHFDDSQILLLFLDDMKVDPNATILTCLKFLGLDPKVALNDIDRPRNTAEEKLEDGSVLDLARRIPLFTNLRDRFVPHTFRRMFKSLLTKPIGERPQWESSTRDWFIEQLAVDNARILEFAGKPQDFWDFSEKKSVTRAA